MRDVVAQRIWARGEATASSLDQAIRQIPAPPTPEWLAQVFRTEDQSNSFASPIEDMATTKSEENELRERRLAAEADDVIFELLNPLVESKTLDREVANAFTMLFTDLSAFSFAEHGGQSKKLTAQIQHFADEILANRDRKMPDAEFAIVTSSWP